MKNIKVRITKKFSFEMAHALCDHAGKCRNIHGHSYQFEITVRGIPERRSGRPDSGMVIDFTEIAKMVEENICAFYDHSLSVSKRFIEKNYSAVPSGTKQIVTETEPTTENILLAIIDKLVGLLPENVPLVAAKLSETSGNSAEWRLEDDYPTSQFSLHR